MSCFWRNEWIKTHLCGGTRVTNWPCQGLNCRQCMLTHNPVRARCIRAGPAADTGRAGCEERGPWRMQSGHKISSAQVALAAVNTWPVASLQFTGSGGRNLSPPHHPCFKLSQTEQRILWTKHRHKFKRTADAAYSCAQRTVKVQSYVQKDLVYFIFKPLLSLQ